MVEAVEVAVDRREVEEGVAVVVDEAVEEEGVPSPCSNTSNTIR